MSGRVDVPPAPGALRTLLTGAAMGTADLVPGFSGGTVALVGGIYPRLIANIRAAAHVVSLVLRLRPRALPDALRALDWAFLITLLIGIVGAAFLLASTLRGLLATQPIVMSAAFLGLVLGAAVAARRQLRTEASARVWAVGGVSAVATALLLGLRPEVGESPSLVLVAATAAVAVCAMILPGVSGSFLLLVLGTYGTIIGAVADRDLALLAVAVAGAVAGLLAFSTLLHWALARAHDVVLAALIGLMVGSARVLWPWPSATGVGDPSIGAPVDQVAAAGLAVVVAFAVVVTLDRALSRAAGPAGPQPTSGPSSRGSR